MRVLLAAAWCYAAQGGASDRRLLEDAAVLHSQRFFSEDWRKKFNAGDVASCAQAYMTDASLHLSFGPLAQLVEKLIPLGNPQTLHGQAGITAFWNASRIVLGFEDMQAFEETGEYASSAMVVDENTVVVTSPIAFKTNWGKVRGEVLSEMWERDKLEWKIRSAMIAFQEMRAPDSNVPVIKPAQAKAADQPQPLTVAPTAAVGQATTPAPAAPRPSGEAPASDLNRTIEAVANGTEAVPAGHGTFLLALGVLVAASLGAVMVRRARNRRAAAISGFESMLG